MNQKIKIFLTIAIIAIVSLILGFTNNPSSIAKDVYQVYLDGKVIGVINSKDELASYINDEQEALKKKYGVETVYAPVGLEIKRYITYQDNIKSASWIYDKIKNERPFTIKGLVFTIDGEENKQEINVLNEEIFKKSLEKTIKAFVPTEDYQKYIDNTQPLIKTTGKRIESIRVKENITFREDYIPTNLPIYITEEELSKYLIFGTTETNEKYTVKENDTISTVALNNNLSPEEFLVANPQFSSVNNLLYTGQEVNVGLIKPQVKVEVIEHVVEDREKMFKTEIIYDQTMVVGSSYIKKAGVNGLERTASKIEVVNGKIESAVPVSSEELELVVNQVVVRGGLVIPYIGDNSYWAWPTKTPYIISSYFGPRWGVLHDGIDITGTGYGSPIYAANNGTVVASEYKATNGNYILVNHNNGLYSMYAHLSQMYVKVGQVVSRGQVIGAMGNSGYSTGTHLHFAIWSGFPYRGGVARNPYNYYR